MNVTKIESDYGVSFPFYIGGTNVKVIFRFKGFINWKPKFVDNIIEDILRGEWDNINIFAEDIFNIVARNIDDSVSMFDIEIVVGDMKMVLHGIVDFDEDIYE